MARNASAIAIVLLAAAMLKAPALLERHRTRFHYYLSAADPELPALLRDTEYTQTSLNVASGVQLRGVMRRPSTSSARFLLIFPGNTANQLASTLPLLRALCANDGTGGAVFSYRGFDGSGGKPSPHAAAHDARAQLAYVRDKLGIAPERLVLVGYSMGSGIALRLAAELAQTGRKPAATLLLSPFWTLDLTPASPLGFFMATERYMVEDIARHASSPLWVIGAAHDSALPVRQHAHRLMLALGDRGEYLELPRAAHADYLDDAALLARMRAFTRGARE